MLPVKVCVVGAGAVGGLIGTRLALAGYALAVLAIAFEEHRVGWLAIALLAGSLVLRLLDRRRTEDSSEADKASEPDQ